MNKVSESIWSSKDVVIPMAEVGHIEKIYHKSGSVDGKIKKGDLSGILVIMKHTAWDMVADTWNGGVWISNIDSKAQQFLKDWCFYRYEVEGGKDGFKEPNE